MKRKPGSIIFGDQDMPQTVEPKLIDGVDGICLYYNKKCDGCLMTVKCMRRFQFVGADNIVHCKEHGHSGRGLLI